MDNLDFHALKLRVYNICSETLSKKQNELRLEVEQLRISIANDSKSSMGDKYETSREMMQQEINRLEHQASLTGQQLFSLRSLNLNKEYHFVEKGSLVDTTIGLFFISVSFGEIKTPLQSCFLISDVAPLAKLLLNKQLWDSFNFNNKRIEILGVY